MSRAKQISRGASFGPLNHLFVNARLFIWQQWHFFENFDPNNAKGFFDREMVPNAFAQGVLELCTKKIGLIEAFVGPGIIRIVSD